jgi:porin
VTVAVNGGQRSVLRRLPWITTDLVAMLPGRESRLRFPPAVALGWLVAIAAILAIPDAARAQISRAGAWDGPGDVCSADTLLGDWGGVRSQLANYGIGFGLQEQTEVWGNLVGGIKRGATYDGLTTANLCIDLDKAMQWPGAKIFTYGFQIWGPGPTHDYVGSLQLISSIEATPSTKLYDLWFEQDLFDGKVSFRFGQGGVDSQGFMAAPYDTVYLNSSFTLPPLIALNLPSGGPGYPLASPMALLMLNPTNEISLMSAVFTEDPAPPGPPGDPQERDLHGTAFRLNDHTLSITELSYSPAFLGDLAGVYKLGMWYASGQFTDQRRAINGLLLANPASNGIPLTHAGDYAFYAIANQMLWHKPKTEGQGIGVFLQVMHGPQDRNINDLWIEAGVNWKGPLPNRSHDEAGIALTYAGIGSYARQYSRDVVYYSGVGSPYAQGEPIIEATYRARLTPWFKVQPDLQYVINTGAGIPTLQAPTPLKNALVIGMRATVNF